MREKGLTCDSRGGGFVLTALTQRKNWSGAAAVADEMAVTGIVHNAYRFAYTLPKREAVRLPLSACPRKFSYFLVLTDL